MNNDLTDNDNETSRLVISELGLDNQVETVSKSIEQRTALLGGLVSKLLLVDILERLNLTDTNEVALISVMDELPSDTETAYPETQEKVVRNPNTNRFHVLNIFSREHVNEFAKENNLKVSFFDSDTGLGFNFATLEKEQLSDKKTVKVEKVFESTSTKANLKDSKEVAKSDVVEKI